MNPLILSTAYVEGNDVRPCWRSDLIADAVTKVTLGVERRAQVSNGTGGM